MKIFHLTYYNHDYLSISLLISSYAMQVKWLFLFLKTIEHSHNLSDTLNYCSQCNISLNTLLIKKVICELKTICHEVTCKYEFIYFWENPIVYYLLLDEVQKYWYSTVALDMCECLVLLNKNNKKSNKK